MTETTDSKLEQKRFVITPESMSAMKRIKKVLPSLEKTYPYLCGVSFFGSRTRGKERGDSDLDLRIFYDTDKSPNFSSTYGGILTSVPVVKRSELYLIKRKIRDVAGLRLDNHDPVAIDISRDSTDRRLRVFSEFVNEFLDNELVDANIDNITSIPPTQDLLAVFFLAVGDDIYKNRSYIVDALKQMPRGEQYFKILMKCLEKMERGSTNKYSTPHYGRLQMTLKDAEKYFLTKPSTSSTEKESSIAA